jgi:predicted transcriptional regulator of viral defense system
VQFIARGNVADIPTETRNTMRGVIRLSTPEATAFDLVGYPQHAGGLSHVATLLSELAEKLDARRLIADGRHSPLPWAQRLGYILERIGAEHLAAALFDQVALRVKEYVPLRAREVVRRASRDSRWRLILNERIEVDQ